VKSCNIITDYIYRKKKSKCNKEDQRYVFQKIVNNIVEVVIMV